VRLMREDEWEPMRMNQKFGPLPNSGLPAQRYIKGLPKVRGEKLRKRIPREEFQRMAADLVRGLSEHDVAEAHGVSRSTVQRARRYM
jgi:hypothetical protein